MLDYTGAVSRERGTLYRSWGGGEIVGLSTTDAGIDIVFMILVEYIILVGSCLFRASGYTDTDVVFLSGSI